MTRQLEVKAEQRESAKRLALIKTLEYQLLGSLEYQGMVLVGLAIRIDPFTCLMTLKVDAEEKRMVAFVSSDTIINVILKAGSMAHNNALKWSADKYHRSEV